MKIGIPRSMLYYDFHEFFKEFFKRLNIEIIVSPKTNINILNEGVLSCVDEACLPIKIFHGHVIHLKDKVDYIFIPRIISSHKREYYCPKQLGLADMVRHSVDHIPNLIDPIIYLDSYKNSMNSLYNLGRFLDKDKRQIKIAAKRTCEVLNKNKSRDNLMDDSKSMNLLVSGHPYNIEDEFINMNIINKLSNVNLLFTKDIDQKSIRASSNNLKKRMFWTHGIDIVGSSYYAIDHNLIDGIIYLSAFGCGLDSVLINLLDKKTSENEIPLIVFNLDEQTGEAGFNTRLEAFLDMMNWRWNNEDKFSPSR